MRIRLWISICAFVWASGYAMAEYRIWTAAGGSVVEAELVRGIGDEVLLRFRSGKEVRIPLDQLSLEDQEYVMLATPPELNIDVVSDFTRRKKGNENSQTQYETGACRVAIKQVRAAVYPAALKAVLYLFARDVSHDNFYVADIVPSSFSLMKLSDGQHTFESSQVAFRLEKHKKRGDEYAGYLVMVYDASGGLIAVKGSRSSFEQNARRIEKMAKNDRFIDDFVVIPSRKRGKTTR